MAHIAILGLGNWGTAVARMWLLEGHKVKGGPKLPLNMLDAIREFDKDKSLKIALGAEFSNAYINLKLKEWNSFTSHFSSWERENTIDI